MGLVPLEENREVAACSLVAMRGHSEKLTVRSLEEGSHKNWTVQAPSSQTSSLQTGEQ